MKKTMTEIDILHKYIGRPELGGCKNILNLLNSFITDSYYVENVLIEVTNLSFAKEKIDELFIFLFIQQRFMKLYKLFDERLSYSMGDLTNDDYFIINDHKFSTLDEVEKAWNNKSFL
jgi:hypothetical protein